MPTDLENIDEQVLIAISAMLGDIFLFYPGLRESNELAQTIMVCLESTVAKQLSLESVTQNLLHMDVTSMHLYTVLCWLRLHRDETFEEADETLIRLLSALCLREVSLGVLDSARICRELVVDPLIQLLGRDEISS